MWQCVAYPFLRSWPARWPSNFSSVVENFISVVEKSSLWLLHIMFPNQSLNAGPLTGPGILAALSVHLSCLLLIYGHIVDYVLRVIYFFLMCVKDTCCSSDCKFFFPGFMIPRLKCPPPTIWICNIQISS